MIAGKADNLHHDLGILNWPTQTIKVLVAPWFGLANELFSKEFLDFVIHILCRVAEFFIQHLERRGEAKAI